MLLLYLLVYSIPRHVASCTCTFLLCRITVLSPPHSLLTEWYTWLTCCGWTLARHFTPNATTFEVLLCNMKYSTRVTLPSTFIHSSPLTIPFDTCTCTYPLALSRANSLRFCEGESAQRFGKRLALRSSSQYGRVRQVAWSTVLGRCSLSPRHCLR